jgi:hypothetical protein
MTFNYDLIHLKELVEDSISNYSQKMYNAGWLVDVEYDVLEIIKENKVDPYSFFKEYEILAMKELIDRGYWIQWSDNISTGESSIVLYRLSQHREGAD